MIKKSELIPMLIFIQLILSIFLIYSESENKGFCIIGSTCETIQNSNYAYFIGIPLVWLGLISFMVLLILFYLQKRHKGLKLLYNVGIILGFLYALYLIIVQAFILKKFCSTCMLIDTLMILTAIASFFHWKE